MSSLDRDKIMFFFQSCLLIQLGHSPEIPSWPWDGPGMTLELNAPHDWELLLVFLGTINMVCRCSAREWSVARHIRLSEIIEGRRLWDGKLCRNFPPRLYALKQVFKWFIRWLPMSYVNSEDHRFFRVCYVFSLVFKACSLYVVFRVECRVHGFE